ncbi:MAG: hypothetical protein JWP59_4437, partial [Massilia sp.]|nr:hypothetical protein [Massilia sp.]
MQKIPMTAKRPTLSIKSAAAGSAAPDKRAAPSREGASKWGGP